MEEEGLRDGDEQIGGRTGNWERGAELGWGMWGIHLLAGSHTHPADASYFKVHHFHNSRNMEDTSQKRRSEMDEIAVLLYTLSH